MILPIPVIFDTNAYRELTHGKTIDETINLIETIRLKEKSKNIIAIASEIVWQELFCHLADPNDKAFDNCYSAIIASYLHCKIENTTKCRIIGDADILLTGSLFNYRDTHSESIICGFSNIIGELYQNVNWQKNDDYRNYFYSIKTATDKCENDFLNTFKDLAKQNAQRNDGKRETLNALKSQQLFNNFAQFIVKRGLEKAKKDINELNDDDWVRHTEFVKSYFSAALYLGIEIIHKLIGNSNFDITKNNRQNWVWDFQMLFYISKINVNLLITDDKAMLDAAKAAGVGDKAIKLDEYKSLLGL